ncbi:hypothetical protein [Agromyces sp. S2-1-8]|uniref:hypothetical protein n=1 Tax=Agromyces sp. S2-1-8 TaxID=2897180 RepID=UPI001E4BA345|nr:hypothetical protein [Agromyces sp. S2-1-8]MCD5345048.1 hypothetical protein [Agromyces sp. S2-1-8]
MTIHEQAVVEFLDVETWDSDAGAWRTLADRVTSVDIKRGAGRSGAANKMEVGTLTARLVGDIDLADDASLRPNSPCRVVMRDARPGASSLVWAPWTNLPGIVSSGGTVTESGEPGTGAYEVRCTMPGGGSGVFQSTLAIAVFAFDPPMIPGRRYRAAARARYRSLELASPLQITVLYGTPIALGAPQLQPGSEFVDLPPFEFTAPDVLPDSNPQLSIRTTVQIDRAVAGNYFDIEVADFRLEMLPEPNTPLITATIADAQQSHVLDKETNKLTTFTTIVAADAVAEHAATPRFGAVAGNGLGHEPWAERITRLAGSAVAPTAPPTADRELIIYNGPAVAGLVGWSRYKDDPLFTNTLVEANGVLTHTFQRVGTSGAILPFWQAPYRTFSQLRPGRTYRVEAMGRMLENVGGMTGVNQWRLEVAGIANGATATVSSAGYVAIPALQFVATGTAHQIRFAIPGGFTTPSGSATRRFKIALTSIRVIEVARPDDYRLRDVVYESTLANHFDLACNSVGARWWVDAFGVTQFRRALDDQQPVARFSDASTPGALHYVDVDTGFDTRSTVTALTLKQHGRKADPDNPGSFIADDADAAFVDETAANRWGARADSLDTCLWLGAGHENDLLQRAGEIFTQTARPRYAIPRIRWNAQENVAAAAQLDIYDRVDVEFTRRSIAQRARVAGLTHKITPTRWIVEIALTDITTGPTFDEFNAAWSGVTFDQLNAAIAGKTFNELNKSPTANAPA